MVKISINRKNGNLKLKELGESNLSTYSSTTYTENNVYYNLHCSKDEVDKAFNEFKKEEIKKRSKEINKLQKEINVFEKAKLPVL